MMQERRPIVFLLTLAIAFSAPALAAGGSLALESFGPESLSLAPQVDFQRAVVTVIGPKEYVLEERFRSDESITLNLLSATPGGHIVGDEGESVRPAAPALTSLTDGLYRYQLRLRSAGREEVQEGAFYVENGATTSRSAKQAELGAARQSLEMERLRPDGGAMSAAAGPASEAYYTSDWIAVGDLADDGNTWLSFAADTSGGSPIEVWALENYQGNFRVLECGSGYPAPYSGCQGTAITLLDDNGYDVGINTTFPVSDAHVGGALEVGGLYPTMILDDIGDWQFYHQGLSLDLHIIGTYTGTIMTFEDAAAGAGSGGVGIFEFNPQAPLHVSSQGDNGDARILVSESNGTATGRELFRLQNNGVPQFRFEDTNSGVTWAFAQQVGGFVANRLGTGGNEMFIQGSGRVQFGPGANVVFDLAPNGNLTIDGTLTQSSSREAKRDFLPLDSAEILDKVAELPLASWRYKKDQTRHVGPMAEDFYEAFDVGEDDKHLAPGDAAGVALAAIQGLNDLVAEKDRELAALKERVERLEELLERAAQ